MITLPTSDYRGMAVEEFNTSKLLRHAAKQARDRRYEDIFIVDVDAHHYETESLEEILDFFDDPVQQQLAKSAHQTVGVIRSVVGYQDIGGRVTRYPLRKYEAVSPGERRETIVARRWMDAMGTDVAFLFPTPMLLLGSDPRFEFEIAMARAYNRWITEKILPTEPRLKSFLFLPFNTPDACVRIVEDFADKKGVAGFMVTTPRYVAVHDNAYMRLYAMLQERGLPLVFHANYNWDDRMLAMANRFITVHALGFCFYTMMHITNWIVNGLPERFPKLDTVWMESGVAWIPYMMQRLDNEYMMRSSECPLLKMLPSDYMRKMYFSTQPMERVKNLSMLEESFKMMNAETQLMWSSDYPHWDFDLPSTIYDLPFLNEGAKRNILGETAAKLFKIDRSSPKLAVIPAT